MEQHVYTVSKLTREIKELLETGFPKIWVEGEISNLKHHSSGHFYFTLKDEGAQINCAMWRFKASQLLFHPQDGIQVILYGDLQLYEKSGRYQVIVDHLQPSGIGELQMKFEQLKNKLQDEGLFDYSHKKPLPAYPEKIGVITSPTGAAIRDITSVAARRFPGIQIIVCPVRVQGEWAPAEIARALNDLNEYGEVDVIIVARGGGSLEDLWAFNEEMVARAIFDSEIPVVSAVGHEVDFSISDFVADYRAPTPSTASELIIKDKTEIAGIVLYYQEKLDTALTKLVERNQDKFKSLQNSYAFRKPLDNLYQKLQRLDELQKYIDLSTEHIFQLKRQNLQKMEIQFNALNPESILNRGYSICYKNNKIVKDSRKLELDDMVNVKLARGEFWSEVKSMENS
jgi:exodeoxyribonuclease VII large subunit